MAGGVGVDIMALSSPVVTIGVRGPCRELERAINGALICGVVVSSASIRLMGVWSPRPRGKPGS